MRHLRDYQIAAADAVMQEWGTHNSTLVVQATGLGKTVLAAEIIRRRQPGRTLVLVHRAELAYQFKEKTQRFTGLECGIEMAFERSERGLFAKTPVVISSVQTQYANNHARVFKPEEFSTLVVDEAHHYVAPAFRKIIEHYRTNPNLKILGLTATPERADEIALGEIFQSVAAKFEIIDGIRAGYLVDIQQVFVPVSGLDYSHVRTTCGDLNQKELAAVLEREEIVQGMIQPILEISWGVPFKSLSGLDVSQWGPYLKENGKPRRSIVFCASIDQAETFSNVINRALPGSSNWLCESTPKDERKELLRAFETGKVYTACQVNILSEGYDNPQVELVIQARATESLVTYTQQIGRATRSLPGVIDGLQTAEERKAAIAASAKPHCTVVDFVGNSGRHKLISCIDALGGEASEDVLEKARKKAATAKPENVCDLLQKSIEEIEAERKRKKEQEEAARRRLVAKSDYAKVEVSPFDACNVYRRRARGWEQNKELSDKQLKIWRRIEPDESKDDNYSFADKKQMIDEHFRRMDSGLCTVQQAIALRKKDPKANTEISWREAAKLTGVPACTPGQAKYLAWQKQNPLLFDVKTASDWITAQKSGQPLPAVPTDSASVEPAKPQTNGDHLTEKEIEWLSHRYRYRRSDLERVSKEEGTRLKMRIIKNGFKPLPHDDPDNSRNWRPK